MFYGDKAMQVENNPYSIFKFYNRQNNKPVEDSKKSMPCQIIPYIGSTAGVGAAMLLSKKMPKVKNKTLNEVAQMLLMAGSANLCGVLAGSVNKTSEQKQKKWREAGFQVMNIAIPMLMVTAALELCRKSKVLDKTIPKIIGSIIGMTSGATIATGITNLTKEKDEPYRKYTIKDSVSNFDDIVATIKLGFDKILKYIPVDKILPFIYIYSGARAGSKE